VQDAAQQWLQLAVGCMPPCFPQQKDKQQHSCCRQSRMQHTHIRCMSRAVCSITGSHRVTFFTFFLFSFYFFFFFYSWHNCCAPCWHLHCSTPPTTSPSPSPCSADMAPLLERPREQQQAWCSSRASHDTILLTTAAQHVVPYTGPLVKQWLQCCSGFAGMNDDVLRRNQVSRWCCTVFAQGSTTDTIFIRVVLCCRPHGNCAAASALFVVDAVAGTFFAINMLQQLHVACGWQLATTSSWCSTARASPTSTRRRWARAVLPARPPGGTGPHNPGGGWQGITPCVCVCLPPVVPPHLQGTFWLDLATTVPWLMQLVVPFLSPTPSRILTSIMLMLRLVRGRWRQLLVRGGGSCWSACGCTRGPAGRLVQQLRGDGCCQ